ncbi:MAG: ATP-binding protein [Pseudomonadota bacterium]
MDAQTSHRPMVNDAVALAKDDLQRDLDWFVTVLETRIKLYFCQDTEFATIEQIEPPQLTDDSPYCRFVRLHKFSFEERITFLLALVPHIKPQLLDLFFVKNATTGRFFVEFGGRDGQGYAGFLPTGETALFVLAGDDLRARSQLAAMFGADQSFAVNGILSLGKVSDHEPIHSGFLILSREAIDLAIHGRIQRAAFGADFPAKRIDTPLLWNDLVLDLHTMEAVLEIKAWVEYGDILMHGLGLAKRLKPGYRALFFGPSGTGKTLTASLIGKAAKLDVYRIDLSMVVSKYIGETEKNLEKVFRGAERKNWILFFDEADALFGKRTDIRDAHDRYANQEVSYLLQRVEDYQGVVILASNLKSNLDEAFTRRFQSIIHFPMPKPAERLRIWASGFAEKMQPDRSADLGEIAKRYELSGGAIMNVVRYATLMTLKNGRSAVAGYDIVEGIRKELRKEGRTA